MKRFGWTVRQTLLGITALLMLVSCNREPDTNKVSGDVKVRIPFPLEGGGYSLQVIGLSGITSLYEFAGKYANFYIYPSTEGNKIHGFRPRAHFIKAGDVYVPDADTWGLSQQMAVVYAHLQRLSLLDQEMGLGDLKQDATDVGLMVRFTQQGRASQEVNNAFYNPETDAILLAPYTDENLPIAINGGVLAHEHFHSLYYKLVGKALGEKGQAHGRELLNGVDGNTPGTGNKFKECATAATAVEKTNCFVYFGLNEGLADFWAWVYTGDPDFLTLSVPSQKDLRSMNVDEAAAKAPHISPLSRWRGIAVSRVDEGCVQPCGAAPHTLCNFYCLGTEYAKSLKSLSAVVQAGRGLSSLEARKLVAKAMVKALPSLAGALKNVGAEDYFEPSNFFTMVADALPEAKLAEKDFLKGLADRAQHPVEDPSQHPAAPTSLENSITLSAAERTR